MSYKTVFKRTVKAEQIDIIFSLKHYRREEHSYYSIFVKTEGDCVGETAKADDFSRDMLYAYSAYERLVASAVRPCHLHDVIYNMLCEDDFVTEKEGSISKRDRETSTCGT